ncbi:MAG: DUF2080 family transposase-associated protein [Candidatus Pacearchaeota archaeon]|nr:DUF2080 family transposase-associated protein [Candidatus Pacearchaeota archaeon]
MIKTNENEMLQPDFSENVETKQVIKWGNSAGILLSKKWINKEVKVILIDRTNEIKKEVLNILEPYLNEIQGIYLVGSYARGEEQKGSDIDIIVISNNLKKEISSGKYEVSIYPLKTIKIAIENNPLTILPRLLEAKTILNESLLKEITPELNKISKKDFKTFFEDTKRMNKMNKTMIWLDKEMKDNSDSTIYSLILRLRGVFIIKCLLKKEKFSNNAFRKWLKSKGGTDIEEAYRVYRAVRDKKKVGKININLEDVKKLSEILGKEVKEYDKSKKKT